MKIRIYTDGACSGNPGKGGWGALIQENDDEKKLSGSELNTTNNRMELTAVIKALEHYNEAKEIEIFIHPFTQVRCMAGHCMWICAATNCF